MESTQEHTDTLPAESPVSVSGELADLLIEFASGLRRAVLYGPRHPAVQEAATAFVTRYSRRRGDRGTLAIAAAGSHLIVEVRPTVELARRFSGVATGLEHPLLGALADRLTRHEVGEMVLAEGVTAKEIAAILGFLSTDPQETDRPLGRESEESLAGLPNVRFHRDHRPEAQSLEVDDEAADSVDAEDLWSTLAAAALGIPEGEEDDDAPPRAASEVANAIAARTGNAAFNRRMSAHLLAVASWLGAADPLESAALAKRFSDLLRRLDRPTLTALLSMSEDANLRAAFLRDAATALDVDVVLELVHAAADGDASDISRWMLRLLSKLARHADGDSGPVAHRSDTGLRDQIKALLTGWDLDNPNPEEYEEALARMSADAGEQPGTQRTQSWVSGETTLAMALEAGVQGPAVMQAVDELLGAGKIGIVARYLEAAPDHELAEGLWRRLAERPVLYRLIEDEQPDWEIIDMILPHAGLNAAEPLLDRLAQADTLAVRRRLFDRLSGLGRGVTDAAVLCLQRPDDTPWYVLRNVLSLLAMFDQWPRGFDPTALTRHDNPQVRLEATKLCLRIPEIRDSSLPGALADESTRVAAVGIIEAERGFPPDAEPRLASIALDEEGRLAEFRTHAIRALARAETAGARDVLMEIAAPRRRGLRRTLPDTGPELLAALSGLANHWRDDPDVEAILERARASSDPRVRKAAE
jgi:hypothetical protein